MRRPWLAALLWVVPIGTIPGLFQLTADVGSAVLRQTGLPESGVVTAGADMKWNGQRASFASSVLGASSSDGRGTGQGLITAALHAKPGGRARWQLAAAASTYGLTNDLPTVSTQLMLREYFGDVRGGVFGGVGGAGIVRNHLWRPALVAQSGAWLRRGTEQWLAAVSATSTVAEEHENFPGYGDYVVTHPEAYGDLSAAWQREGRGYTLAVVGGFRAGFRNVGAFDGWGSATAEAWVAPHVALVGTLGRALGDVLRGVPPTRYATVALRLAIQPRVALVRRPNQPPGRGPRLAVAGSGDAAARRIEVQIDKASSVEIMADFTSWEAVALTLDTTGGVWRLERPIEAGPHRVAVRVDGGEWSAPVNLPRVSNGFGGMVGLVTVP
jgi:hypothetical protein